MYNVCILCFIHCLREAGSSPKTSPINNHFTDWPILQIASYNFSNFIHFPEIWLFIT